MLFRKGELEPPVLGGGPRVGNQVIAKQEVALPDWTVNSIHVEDVSPYLLSIGAALLRRMAPEEEAITGDVDFIRTLVKVADIFQRLNAPLPVLELVQQHGDIEDGLGRHTRNRRAADMMDTYHDVPDGLDNAATLLLEQQAPIRVVRYDDGAGSGNSERHR